VFGAVAVVTVCLNRLTLQYRSKDKKTDRRMQEIFSQQEFLDADDSDDSEVGGASNSVRFSLLSYDLDSAG
jgi:hypothetical protein